MTATGLYKILNGILPEKMKISRFSQPEFPKKSTNPKIVRMDGMAKGMDESVLSRGDFPVPISHAPGSPIARESKTLKNACFNVKNVIRKSAEFPQILIKSLDDQDVQKLAPYGIMKANNTAAVSGSANKNEARRLIAVIALIQHQRGPFV
jgi:hypothetical protein